MTDSNQQTICPCVIEKLLSKKHPRKQGISKIKVFEINKDLILKQSLKNKISSQMTWLQLSKISAPNQKLI